jgi:hypothetical protein
VARALLAITDGHQQQPHQQQQQQQPAATPKAKKGKKSKPAGAVMVPASIQSQPVPLLGNFPMGGAHLDYSNYIGLDGQLMPSPRGCGSPAPRGMGSRPFRARSVSQPPNRGRGNQGGRVYYRGQPPNRGQPNQAFRFNEPTLRQLKEMYEM